MPGKVLAKLFLQGGPVTKELCDKVVWKGGVRAKAMCETLPGEESVRKLLRVMQLRATGFFDKIMCERCGKDGA